MADERQTPFGPEPDLENRLGELGALDRDLVDDELDEADLGLVEWPSGAPGLEDRATWRVRMGHAGPESRTIEIERLTPAAG